MRLQGAGLDALNLDPAPQLPQMVAKGYGIAVVQAEALRIFRRHENSIAGGAGEWILIRQHHAVELLAAAGGQQKLAWRHFLLGQVHGAKVAFAVGGEEAVGEQAPSAVLEA